MYLFIVSIAILVTNTHLMFKSVTFCRNKEPTDIKHKIRFYTKIEI